MPPYKKPILVAVLQFIGVINGLIAVLMAIVAFTQRTYGNEGVTFGILFLLGGLISVVLFFGLAQCVDFLGRTAYQTERTASLLERQATPAPISHSAKEDAWRRAQRGEA